MLLSKEESILGLNVFLGAQKFAFQEGADRQATLIVILRSAARLLDEKLLGDFMQNEDFADDFGHMFLNMGSRDWQSHHEKWAAQRPMIEALLAFRKAELDMMPPAEIPETENTTDDGRLNLLDPKL